MNILVQTDRSIPPHAIMKRRKGGKGRQQDHREECGGVETEAVEAPALVCQM